MENSDVLSRNKKLVCDFYELAINQKNFEEARKFLGSTYVQHNPTIRDGEEGLRDFIDLFRDKFPGSRVEFKRVIAQDDYVVLHSHGTSGPHPNGTALVDIFRVRDGEIVEHWDVMQEIPEGARNENSMF